MERAAELVEAPGIPAHERLPLLFGEVSAADRVRRVVLELVAERAILLQPVLF